MRKKYAFFSETNLKTSLFQQEKPRIRKANDYFFDYVFSETICQILKKMPIIFLDYAQKNHTFYLR